MPFPLLPVLAGAGLVTGVGKYFLDKSQADEQNRINAAGIRYSPWTGVRSMPQNHHGNLAGDLLSMGSVGANLAQNIEQQGIDNESKKSQQEYYKAMSDNLNRNITPWSLPSKSVGPVNPTELSPQEMLPPDYLGYLKGGR